MPPKPKITKEALLAQAYAIARDQGISAVTSRSLAHAAGCSIQPVFTHFPTMEDLRRETYLYTCRKCAEEVLSSQGDRDFLTALTLWMLDLSKNRANLFHLLYLADDYHFRSVPKTLMDSGSHRIMVERVSRDYGLSKEDSEDVLLRMCLFLMGLGTLISVNRLDIGDAQFLQMMHKTLSDLLNGKTESGPEAPPPFPEE